MHTPGLTDPVTVIITDSGRSVDLLRCLRQVTKTTSPRDVEVVVASVRTISLPGPMGRRVRKIRSGSPEQTDLAVAAEVVRDRLVLVTAATSLFSPGWLEEARTRAAAHPQLISSVTAVNGGLLLFPPAVRTNDAPRVDWHAVRSLRFPVASRALAHQTVSAVMIVKDEEDVLDECLTALSPFVDEIVVYDTGSTDETKAIARQHGVTLVEGYWDDHFGDARNRALAHATSDWILQVDADEVVTGDVDELRSMLDGEVAEQIHVTIVSGSWKGATTGLETRPIRLFRRGTSQWQGALHEFPAPVDGRRAAVVSPTPAPLTLLHSGYEQQKVKDRNKAARNLELSRRELTQAPADSHERANLLSNYGRSLMWDGRTEEALDVFEELRSTPGNTTAVVIAGRAALGINVQLGRFELADQWWQTLAEHGESAGNLAVLKARRHMASGEFSVAESILQPFLDGQRGGSDPWSVPFDPSVLTVVLAELDLRRGAPKEAARRLLPLVTSAPKVVDLAVLLDTFVAGGLPLSDIADVAPEEFLARSLREASLYHPSGALAWFEAFRAAHPGDHRPVVAGSLFAGRADWKTALTWSVHARELGLKGVCSLRGLADRESAPLVDRCVAWALLAEIFAEEDAEGQFERLTVLASSAEEALITSTLAEVGIMVSDAELTATTHDQAGITVG